MTTRKALGTCELNGCLWQATTFILTSHNVSISFEKRSPAEDQTQHEEMATTAEESLLDRNGFRLSPQRHSKSCFGRFGIPLIYHPLIAALYTLVFFALMDWKSSISCNGFVTIYCALESSAWSTSSSPRVAIQFQQGKQCFLSARSYTLKSKRTISTRESRVKRAIRHGKISSDVRDPL